MYQTINKCDFHDAFLRMGRKDNFSYEGLNHLYDYLIDMEESDNPESNHAGYELDVIALCCEYAEDDVYNVLKEYDLESIDELEEKTMIVWHDQENAIVLYQQF